MHSLSTHESHATSNLNFDDGCSDFVKMAEQELSAFFSTVTQMFGAPQAEASAEDWLRQLCETDVLPACIREWQLITVKASTQLANRVSAEPLPA